MNKDSVDKKRSKDLLGPIILIAIGALFLLNNLGYLPWNIWFNLWRFWPVLLILTGLQILTRGSRILSIIFVIFSILVILIVLLFSTGYNIATRWFNINLPSFGNLRNDIGYPRQEIFTVTVNEFPEIEKMEVDLDLGAGIFEIKDSNKDEYFTLHATYFDNSGKPEYLVRNQNNTLIIDVEEKGFTGFQTGDIMINYNINFGKPEIPMDLNVDLGAGKMNLVLDKKNTGNVRLIVGAGSISSTFSEQSIPEELILEVGAGTMNVLMPENVGLRVNYEVGLGNLNINGENFRGDGEFVSTNYDQARIKTEIKVNIGIGNVKIEM